MIFMYSVFIFKRYLKNGYLVNATSYLNSLLFHTGYQVTI